MIQSSSQIKFSNTLSLTRQFAPLFLHSCIRDSSSLGLQFHCSPLQWMVYSGMSFTWRRLIWLNVKLHNGFGLYSQIRWMCRHCFATKLLLILPNTNGASEREREQIGKYTWLHRVTGISCGWVGWCDHQWRFSSLVRTFCESVRAVRSAVR